jgi:fermentation-respiration switch protein FrsA (DUF1100 family)
MSNNTADKLQQGVGAKELFIVPSAGHVDLYDRVNLIPWDKLQSFFGIHLAGAKAPW